MPFPSVSAEFQCTSGGDVYKRQVQNAKTVHRRLTAIRHPHWYSEQGACSVPVRVQLSPKNRLADRLNAKRQSIGLRLP